MLMYRSTLRPPSCRQSPFHSYFCHFHVRRLASAGSVPVVNSDQHAIETLEPWQENVAISLAKNKTDAKNIIVDDLTATLEAHRASNRALVIRRTPVIQPVIREIKNAVIDTRGLKKRPLSFEHDNNGDSGTKNIYEEVHEEIHQEKEEKFNPMWPLDSAQAKAEYGEKRCKTYYKKGDALEYTGAVAWPQRPWKQERSFKDTQDTPMKRPWLAYMKTTGDDNLEWFVLESRQGWF